MFGVRLLNHPNFSRYILKFCCVRHSFTGTRSLYRELLFWQLADFARTKSPLSSQGCLPYKKFCLVLQGYLQWIVGCFPNFGFHYTFTARYSTLRTAHVNRIFSDHCVSTCEWVFQIPCYCKILLTLALRSQYFLLKKRRMPQENNTLSKNSVVTEGYSPLTLCSLIKCY